LGKFLDDLRLRLAPGCRPHAHVTLLPPRPICAPPEHAMDQIHQELDQLPPFELSISDVAIFPVTNVIYLEIGAGRSMLVDLHRTLNRGPLAFEEPFEYHPHVTLGQELPFEQVEPAAAEARRLWASFPHSRRVLVNELTFVRNTKQNCWLDL